MAARSDQRKAQANERQQQQRSHQAERIGYVPRSKQSDSMAATGYTSTGMMTGGGRGGNREGGGGAEQVSV